MSWPIGTPPAECPRCGNQMVFVCTIQGGYCEPCNRPFTVPEETLRQLFGEIDITIDSAATRLWLEGLFARSPT